MIKRCNYVVILLSLAMCDINGEANDHLIDFVVINEDIKLFAKQTGNSIVPTPSFLKIGMSGKAQSTIAEGEIPQKETRFRLQLKKRNPKTLEYEPVYVWAKAEDLAFPQLNYPAARTFFEGRWIYKKAGSDDFMEIRFEPQSKRFFLLIQDECKLQGKQLLCTDEYLPGKTILSGELQKERSNWIVSFDKFHGTVKGFAQREKGVFFSPPREKKILRCGHNAICSSGVALVHVTKLP